MANVDGVVTGQAVPSVVNVLDVFHEETDNVEDWIDRFEMYLTINNVQDDRKVAYLLTHIGGVAYSVLKDLCIPDVPSTVAYDTLVEYLKGHYVPHTLQSVCRLKFRQAKQQSGESVTQFVHRLKQLAKDCGFGANLKDSLKDQIIVGIGSPKIARALLMKADLTFEVAVTTCTSMETAERDTEFLMNGQQSLPVSAGILPVRKVLVWYLLL